jgi:hypothetical protein
MERSSPFRGTNLYLGCSPQDQQYLERLRIHLRPMEVEGLIQVGDEASIQPGALYQTEIEHMIVIASVAVLLVSADFLASPEIAGHILPLILEKARLNTMTILTIIVGYCAFQDSLLAPYKPINNPARPLRIMGAGEKEMVWQEVVQAVKVVLQEDQKKNKTMDVDQSLSRQSKEMNVVPTHRSEDTEPVLDESAIEPLINALLNAFPTQRELKLLISYKLHQNMEIIAAGSNLEEQAYSLVMWAYSQGQMKALITGALARNPGNSKLRKFATEHGF